MNQLAVELEQQVVDFVRSSQPGPREALRCALRNLQLEHGDIRALEGELEGFYRLRVHRYRVIFHYHLCGGTRGLFAAFTLVLARLCTKFSLNESESFWDRHMNKLFTIMLFVQLVAAVGFTAQAADVTEAELLQAATTLARQYDEHYAARDPAGMASLFTSDGVLVSPAGPIIRGREALKTYYTKRFASGAKGHAIKVLEVHVQGNGGYGLSEFSVTTPQPNGELRQVHGTIVSVYQQAPDGWHLRLVIPSVPESGK
jgi:uncharacterized protein (TIGR02246 family)